MPRISKKHRLEWSFFLNDRNLTALPTTASTANAATLEKTVPVPMAFQKIDSAGHIVQFL